ncbi:hypothetical protein L596_003694 [Steinernema carpocapsae]|uniref:Uncharacterized protein n=1 Tax=Steinernema carpocapsae TaxID=34508 RepID=A0A4U8UV06_STECR|nr:hypothetical protein L596_003694 [Steinernema carpocapsae]
MCTFKPFCVRVFDFSSSACIKVYFAKGVPKDIIRLYIMDQENVWDRRVCEDVRVENIKVRCFVAIWLHVRYVV